MWKQYPMTSVSGFVTINRCGEMLSLLSQILLLQYHVYRLATTIRSSNQVRMPTYRNGISVKYSKWLFTCRRRLPHKLASLVNTISFLGQVHNRGSDSEPIAVIHLLLVPPNTKNGEKLSQIIDFGTSASTVIIPSTAEVSLAQSKKKALHHSH